MSFKEIKPQELIANPFTLIGDDWLLITAGNMEKHNTMTASWGGVGILWNKPVATVYIRPQRYTKSFVDANDTFTLTVLPDEQHDAHKIAGSLSGRDIDKDKECNLVPFLADENDCASVAYENARLILVCKKLYRDTIKGECFTVEGVDEKCYPKKDYHDMYIAEITKVLVKE